MEPIVRAGVAGKKAGGISGGGLKIIAVICMFVDHMGAVLLFPELVRTGAPFSLNLSAIYESFFRPFDLYTLYLISRFLGRLSFPLFCFLLVEGFLHTKNVARYAGRLFLFALLSEIPFDLAFYGTPFFPAQQNVFFTLLLGLASLLWIERSERRLPSPYWQISALFGTLLAGFAASVLQTDYSSWGVLVIAVLYILRQHRILSFCLGCALLTVMSSIEIVAFLLVPILLCYNGARGIRLRYFFYCFYPVHLLLLYGLTFFPGR